VEFYEISKNTSNGMDSETRTTSLSVILLHPFNERIVILSKERFLSIFNVKDSL